MTVAWSSRRRRSDPLLAVRLWGPLLALLAAVYYACGAVAAPQRLVPLVLTALWGGWSMLRVPQSVSGPTGDRASEADDLAPLTASLQPSWLGHVWRIFLASAPLLVIEANQDAGALGWADGLALCVWGACFFMSLSAKGRRAWRGESLVGWAIYLHALAVPGGFLTLFAPLLWLGNVQRLRMPGGGGRAGAGMSIGTHLQAKRRASEV